MRAGSSVKVSGTLYPSHKAKTKVTVIAQRYSGSRVLTTVSKTVYISTGKHAFSTRLTLKTKGSWRIRIKHADATHATTYSVYRYTKVK